MVNINERRLVAWRRGFVTEKVDLVGLEYLWKAVLVAPDNIVYKPIELLRDVYTNLSPKLQQDQVLCVDPHRVIYTLFIFHIIHTTLYIVGKFRRIHFFVDMYSVAFTMYKFCGHVQPYQYMYVHV